MGGSIGIAILTTLLVRRSEYHRVVLIEKITPFSAEAMHKIQALSSVWSTQGFSPLDAREHAVRMLDGIVQQQAITLSYEDLSWILGVALLLTLPFVFALSAGKKAPPKDIEMH
jgi:MFS transporter, DHA2 family, multidrug resistance protein